MSAAAMSFRTPVLPWTISAQDEADFKRIVRTTIVAALILAIALPWLPNFQPDRDQVQELPPAFTKLILERDRTPPPPPPKAAAPDRPAEANQPKPDKPAPEAKSPQARPEVKPQASAVSAARSPQPNKAPGENLEAARRMAAGVGLLAMKDELAQLQGAPVAVQLKQDIKAGAGVGSGVGVGIGAGNETGTPTRALITSNATGGSGGINTAGYSRSTGGGGLAGRATTLVEGAIGGGGGGGAGGGLGNGGVVGGKGNGADGGAGGAGGTLAKGGSGKASRSIEEIKLVFERHKGAIYAIYNRALREEPSLQGKVVLELKIAPSGQVLDCRVVSSELKAAELEAKLLARIRSFDFGAKDVDQMVVTWPVDFLPS